MAYGKKYYMSFERTFENPKGESVTKNYLFNIYFQGYTGTAIELPCMGDSPVVLRYDGDKDNIFEPILGGSMEFELVNQTGFVFDDMIEAGDADCWCELCEIGVVTPTVVGYIYSDNFLSIDPNPSGYEGSPARIQGYEFNLGGEIIKLADDNSATLEIPYTDSASFPMQSNEIFIFMINKLNALFAGKNVVFIDAGNNVMQVKSTSRLNLIANEDYSVGDSKVQIKPSLITSEPTPIVENIGPSQLVFSGFLSPAGIVRSYTNSTHIMRFVATDGLNLLNGQSYGATQADLSNVKIIDVIKNALNFRNAITTTAIKDDLFIEWDFTAASQGQQGGSQCPWVMVETGGNGEYIRVAYEFIVRVYRLDGIAYDTYTFKNKGDNDKLWLPLGEYTYDQDGTASFIYFDSERMIEEASRLFSSKLQEELRALNVNSDYLYDVNNKTIGIKSSVKVYLERVVFDGEALTLSNSYTSPVTSPIDLHTLGNEGCLFAGKSLYDNMSGILKSFGWRMYYYKGWRIERVLNIGKGTRTFKKYANVTGDIVEVNLVSIKDEASGFNIESGATETRISSWKDAIFKQPYGKKDSLIYNSFDVKDFAYTKEFNSYAYKWATGTAYCLKDKSGKNLLIGTRNNTVDYAIFKGYGEPNKLTVKYVAVSPTESVNIKLKVGDQWLGNDGILHSTMQTITRQPAPSGDVTVEIDFITNTPTTLVLFLSNQTFESGGRDALVSEFSVGGHRLKESSIGYELQLNINQLNRNKTKEVEFLLGTTLDAPQYPSYYAGLINSNGTPVYAVSDGINTGRLADIIANEYAYVYARNRMCISGTLLQNVEPNDSFKFANGKMLAFASIGSFDIKRNRLDGEFVEVVTNPYILYTADLPVINIAPLDTATLPTQVLCTYSDGTAANAPITWKPFNYTFPGTYYAEGSIGVNIMTIKQQVIIGNIISYTPIADITVSEGMTPTLPTTANCTTDNGFTRDYAIEWGEYSTATQGTFIVKGKLFNRFEVQVNLIVTALTDLDILRMIRDANPSSQLPTLWLDSEDPYTQWEGVTWELRLGIKRVTILQLASKNIKTLYNLNKLKYLQYLYSQDNIIEYADLSNLNNLLTISINNNKLIQLIINGCILLNTIYLEHNKLILINSLTSKGLIIYYDFRYNNFPPDELDRLRALGFTNESRLLPQKP